jgi:hypothetical protein
MNSFEECSDVLMTREIKASVTTSLIGDKEFRPWMEAYGLGFLSLHHLVLLTSGQDDVEIEIQDRRLRSKDEILHLRLRNR